MDNNYQTEKILKSLESMDDSDLLSAYKNRNVDNHEFAELLVEEMGLRGYDAAEIDKIPFEDIDVAVIKNKENDELVEIYHKQNHFKNGWGILAKNELKNRGINVEQITGKKQYMFERCFAFKGRIRRLEYGLTFIIILVLLLPEVLITNGNSLSGVGSGYTIFTVIVILLFRFISLWLLFSQGTKRCHDIGRSGWWQLVPLYNLIIFFSMLFKEGEFGINEYGENPKR